MIGEVVKGVLSRFNPVNMVKFAQLQTRCAEQDKLLKLRQEMKLVGQFYRKQGEDTDYCPRCWKASDIDMPVSPPISYSGGIKRACPNCHEVYWEKQPEAAFAVVNFARSRWLRDSSNNY